MRFVNFREMFVVEKKHNHEITRNQNEQRESGASNSEVGPDERPNSQRLAHRLRKTHRTTVATLVHRADAEKIIVLRHALHGVARDVASRTRVRPNR
jgi:thiamine kinase-like enzyme